MYVAIKTKSDYGCELHGDFWEESGVLLCVMIVKSVEEENKIIQEVDVGLLYGTSVMLGLVSPWQNTNHIVCADSYIVLVPAASELLDIGLISLVL